MSLHSTIEAAPTPDATKPDLASPQKLELTSCDSVSEVAIVTPYDQAFTAAQRALVMEEVVDNIVQFASRGTQVACLRVNELFHKAAGKHVYEEVLMRPKQLGDVLLGALRHDTPEPTKHPWRTTRTIARLPLARGRNFKAPLLKHVRVMRVTSHLACHCAHFGPHAAKLLPNLTVLILEMEEYQAPGQLCTKLTRDPCKFITALQPRTLLLWLNHHLIPIPREWTTGKRPRWIAPSVTDIVVGNDKNTYPGSANIRRWEWTAVFPNLQRVLRPQYHAHLEQIVLWTTDMTFDFPHLVKSVSERTTYMPDPYGSGIFIAPPQDKLVYVTSIGMDAAAKKITPDQWHGLSTPHLNIVRAQKVVENNRDRLISMFTGWPMRLVVHPATGRIASETVDGKVIEWIV